jgi:hypothetical protein
MLDEVEEALAEYQVATDGERSEARERWRTARAAVLARMSTPPGYKLVPVEPNDHMLSAPTQTGGEPYNGPSKRLVREIYAVMLAAAPTEVK